RELPDGPGFPTDRVQDETVRPVPVVTHLAASRLVASDMLVAEEAVVRHAARVYSAVIRLGTCSPGPAPTRATTEPSAPRASIHAGGRTGEASCDRSPPTCRRRP